MNDEQYNMLVQAKVNVRDARDLFGNKSYRSAASRAYYAMFHVATAVLLEENLAFSKHSAVIAAFGQHVAGHGSVPREYHRFLIDAEEKRGIADYDFATKVSAEDAAEVLGYAEKFVELGERLLGPVSEHD
jgi:uncharacterized protein (UPF0332 family)